MKKPTVKFEKELDTSQLWVVPYADFLTVIMIFFMMMFAFAYAEKSKNKTEKVAADIQKEMGGVENKELAQKMLEEMKAEQMASELDKITEEENLKKYVSVTVNSEQIKIVFSNPILFDIGKADLKPESRTILSKIGKVLKAKDNEIIVEGHTDNVPVSGGKFKSNWELSVARAMAVIRFFVHMQGLPPKRFVAAGYGEYRPIVPNDTEEGRDQNRRIEINVIRKKETEVKAAPAGAAVPAPAAAGG